jgi:hypothetical protein
MSDIINPENIKPDIDLKELEKSMISGGMIQQRAREPQDRFSDELKDYATKLGIDFEDITKDKQKPKTADASKFADKPKFADTLRFNPPSRDSDHSSESESDDDQDESDDDNGNQYGYSGSPQPARISSPTNSLQFARNSFGENYQSKHSSSDEASPRADYGQPERYRFGSDLSSRTREQERRSQIDSVVGGSYSGAISFEKEKREDTKCAMLEEIDSLMESLSGENVELGRVPQVGRTSSYEEVETVLKMLRHKNDRTRYCSFAEEFVLFGAVALEELFDGKRTWFGHYQPDLTDWHNQVNVKLRRMRHDTSTLVSGVMNDYNIGPGARILLELVPNMFLHSRNRKRQAGASSLFSDSMMIEAAERLRME